MVTFSFPMCILYDDTLICSSAPDFLIASLAHDSALTACVCVFFNQCAEMASLLSFAGKKIIAPHAH